MVKKKISQSELIYQYFKDNPLKPISHPEIVDWATKEYLERTGTILRDPDRAIRKLHSYGFLIKVSKGIYMYDPEFVASRDLEDFTASQKAEVLRSGNYKCAVCGRGLADGVELHIDHIKPKELGGKATIENGQVLCGTHNYRKKMYGQTETGKKMFINLYELAKKSGDKEVLEFTTVLLEVFEKNGINGHIEWKK